MQYIYNNNNDIYLKRLNEVCHFCIKKSFLLPDHSMFKLKCFYDIDMYV